MPSSNWFSLSRGVIGGPYLIEQIRAMRQRGALDRFAKVSQDRVTWTDIDVTIADIDARTIAPPPVAPPAFTGLPGGFAPTLDPAHVQFQSPVNIRPFPVFAFLLLHYLTFGSFSFFWFASAHGRLPKMKSDDPSGFKAVAFCFVPFLQIYWFWFMYGRLAQRINALSTSCQMPAIIPLPLAYAHAALVTIPLLMMMIGLAVLAIVFFSPVSTSELDFVFFILPHFLSLLNYLVIMPVFGAFVQVSLNRIADAQLHLAIAQRTPSTI